jgi:hypothetical protein
MLRRTLGGTSTTLRYCRRCWPDAHRAEIARRNAGGTDQLKELLDAAAAVRQGVVPAQDPTKIVRVTCAWHWSLAPGTLWRERRARRSLGDEPAA